MSHKGNGKVPFVDLIALHQEIQSELVDVFNATLASAGFIGGHAVEEFERGFAAYCETEQCVGVGSGTDALRFALLAVGVRPGDIVVTVPLTFIATTEAISQVGARPAFVDIDARTYTMDPDKLRAYLETECVLDSARGRYVHRVLGRPVTAVIPVHLYGQTADMDPILELAADYKLIVIEDACQAHGAEYFSKKENRWRKAGSMGQAAAFSFYPGKNLGACGEGGAVTTDNLEVARKIRVLRDHGQSKKYYHDVEGYNGRLDAIQAGILSVKLKHLEKWNRLRCEAASRYELRLEKNGNVIVPYHPEWASVVWHLYVVRVADREGLKKWLADSGVDTAIHYPIPLHLQSAYQSLGYAEGSFPVTEAVSEQILSLPMYPQLSAPQQERVVQGVLEFVQGQGSLRGQTEVLAPAQRV
jgi:dTDP-4-amino-4,6-dideoxygalactose transaminase